MPVDKTDATIQDEVVLDALAEAHDLYEKYLELAAVGHVVIVEESLVNPTGDGPTQTPPIGFELRPQPTGVVLGEG